MEAQVVTIDQPFHSAYEKFIEIMNHLSSETFCEKTHSEIEAYLEADGRELLRLLLQDHLDTRGSGRVGEAVCGSDGVVRPHKRDHMEIGYKSVFGGVRVARTGYNQRGVASLFPLDAQLNLPAHGYSHRLQKRVALKAVKDSFEGVVNDIEAETGVRIGKRQVEAIVYAAAQDFDAFYAQPCTQEVQRQAHGKPIQVLTFDGKGVVMRKEALREGTRKKAEASTQRPPQGFVRKEKANRKRMATVAGIYHVDRHMRSPQTVAQQFAPLRLVPRNTKAAPKPVAKKLWASLEKPMKTVIEAGFAEGRRRDPEQQAEWIALVDGDPTQIDYIEKAATAYGVTVVIILDIMHALEYLWKATNALFDPEESKAVQWVADKIEQLLEGQVNSMVRSLRRSATLKGLSPKQREPIDQCATYLANHAPYLNYPHYLANGYPIATGVIEGACRHLVKDRMEITGARWGLEGGEAVLKLRALSINGEFDEYWEFHEKQEYQRNHQAKFSEMSKARPPLHLIAGGKCSLPGITGQETGKPGFEAS
jgi:hypothetical protein